MPVHYKYNSGIRSFPLRMGHSSETSRPGAKVIQQGVPSNAKWSLLALLRISAVVFSPACGVAWGVVLGFQRFRKTLSGVGHQGWSSITER